MNKREYKQRRRALMKHLGPNSIAIIPTASEKTRNRDSHYRYRADSDFVYLTGFKEPESIAVLIPGRKPAQFILFCRENDKLMEIWNGRRAGLEGAKRDYNAEEVYPITKLDEVLPQLMENRERVFYTIGKDEGFDKRLIEWVNQVRQKARAGIVAPQEFIGLDHLIHEMRLVKSAAEIRVMRKAANISAEAHVNAMKNCKPGVREHVVEAEISHSFTK